MIVSMGGVEEGIKTTMEVDSIITKVVIENTQVTLDTIEVAFETMHPSTLSTILETEEGIENLQLGDGTRITPMVQ